MGEGRNLVLSGLMGSGKSTIGRHVARMLGRRFTDTDKAVEQAVGCTVAEIFAREGEGGFRAHERRVVAQIARQPGSVISLGGGVVLDPGNVDALREHGQIVWIDVPIDALVHRLSSSSHPGKRPLLEGTQDPVELRALLTRMRAERHDAYAGSADYVLDTMGRPSEHVAQEVFAWALEQPDLLTPQERP